MVHFLYYSVLRQPIWDVTVIITFFHFWYRWCTLTCEYLREFSKKIRNDPSVVFRGFGEDDSWKNLKQKIFWHCPFKYLKFSVLRWSIYLCPHVHQRTVPCALHSTTESLQNKMNLSKLFFYLWCWENHINADISAWPMLANVSRLSEHKLYQF